MPLHTLAGEGLLAHVVVSKYVDHLPLYRLSRILLRERVDVSRATLCGWVADVAAALAPIDAQLRREVTAARYLHTDDTPVTILDAQARQPQRPTLDVRKRPTNAVPTRWDQRRRF